MKIALKNNNYIYIFAQLSDTFYLWKLDNHPMERSGSINKRASENILKCH